MLRHSLESFCIKYARFHATLQVCPVYPRQRLRKVSFGLLVKINIHPVI